MLKVRVMGNKEEIHWFQETLAKNKQMDLIDFSDVFSCANTRKYYRAYCQVQKKNEIKNTK
ncbi:MAG: hypothetical protein ACOX8M_07490 [Marvinbryantia sp.]